MYVALCGLLLERTPTAVSAGRCSATEAFDKEMSVGRVLSIVYVSPLTKSPLWRPTPPKGVPAASRIVSLSLTSSRKVPLPVPVATATE